MIILNLLSIPICTFGATLLFFTQKAPTVLDKAIGYFLLFLLLVNMFIVWVRIV
jgi:hypothetical protein